MLPAHNHIHTSSTPHALSRRRFGHLATTLVATLASAATVSTLAACGSSNTATTSPNGSAWTFTDDQARTHRLPATPQRIAGFSDSMAALMDFGLKPLALFGRIPVAEDTALTGRDLAGVELVGSVYGEIELEKLAAAKPDLIVTTVYIDDPKNIGVASKDEVPYGIKDAAQLKALEKIAPVLTIAMSGNGMQVIERWNQLATALGVDLNSGQPASDKKEFEAAQAELKTAGTKGLVVQTMAAYDGDGIYVARAADDPQLSLLESSGVKFIDLKTTEYFWDHISWENIDKYPCDLILQSLMGAMSIADLKKQPTAAKLPAVMANQVHEWRVFPLTYRSQAKIMRELTGWLIASKKVI